MDASPSEPPTASPAPAGPARPKSPLDSAWPSRYTGMLWPWLRRRLPARDPWLPRAVAIGMVASALIVGPVAVSNMNDSPADVVSHFLEAVRDKDIPTALSYTGLHGLDGESARFIRPEAISDDWTVVSVAEHDRQGRDESTVSATIGGPDGTATGEFALTSSYSNGWTISDPFGYVSFSASPLAYSQVNEMSAPLYDRPNNSTYALLPGLYHFYQDAPGLLNVDEAPVAVFPQETGSDAPSARPAKISMAADGVTEVQRLIEERLDDCANFTVALPIDCPFGTGDYVDTTDGKRVDQLHDLRWDVTEYPRISLSYDPDSIEEYMVAGLSIDTQKPGVVALNGSGVDTKGKSVDFTIECAIELGDWSATVDQNERWSLWQSHNSELPDPFDTCYEV